MFNQAFWDAYKRRFPTLLGSVLGLGVMYGALLSAGMPREYLKWICGVSGVIIAVCVELISQREKRERE